LKNFRQTLFSGQEQLAQILNKNIHVQYSEFRAPSVFQGRGKLLKTPECKSIFNTARNFRASAELLKNPDGKNILNTVENFKGKLCSQGKRKLLKILIVTSVFNTVKIQGNSFFQGKRKLLNNPE